MSHSRKGFNLQEAIVPGISLLFGCAYFVQTNDAPWVAIQWPYALAGLTFFLWLGVVGRYVLRPTEGSDEASDSGPGSRWKPLVILIAPILYVGLMPSLGFAISSLLFLTLLFRLLGGRSWLVNGLVALAMTAFLYVAMIVLMQMALPRLEIGSILL